MSLVALRYTHVLKKKIAEILAVTHSAGLSILGLPLLGPVIDGGLLPDRTDQLLDASQLPQRAVVTGSNADEMTLFTINQSISVDQFERLIQGTFGLIANTVLELIYTYHRY